MSQETSTWLNTRTLIGFTEQRGHAWHYRADDQSGEPNHYPGAVPVADVQRRLFGWDAVAASVFAEYFDEDGFVRLTDASRQAIVRPAGAFGPKDAGAILGLFKDGYVIHQFREWLLDATLDLLDLVWRLRRVNDGRALLRLASAERTARLADSPATVDELAGRLAALTDVIEKLDVPGSERQPALSRLRDVCVVRLDPAGVDRVGKAIGVLQLILRLRNGLTHTGRAPAKAYAAAAQLGLSWPPTDPADTWHRIVGQAVTALDAIRDELDLAVGV